MKTLSRRALVFLLLAFAVAGSSVRAASAPADPILGNWLWREGREVTFETDGTVTSLKGPAGTWKYLGNPEVQRHYQIVWAHGQYIDTLVCSEDAQSGHVHNQNGMQYNVRRAIDTRPAAVPATPGPTVAMPMAVKPAPVPTAPSAPPPTAVDAGTAPSSKADPVIGEWLGHGNHPMTFNADGTVTHPDGLSPGTWEFLRNPELERQYRILWNNGKSFDLLFWVPGTRTARVTSKSGHTYEAHPAAAGLAAPAKSTEANYFGAPKN